MSSASSLFWSAIRLEHRPKFINALGKFKHRYTRLSIRSPRNPQNVSTDGSRIRSRIRVPFGSSAQRSVVLCAFALFIALSMVALAILKFLDMRYTGFYVSQRTSSYIWTFAPTAIFTIAIAFWRQLDYRVKARAPWDAMAKGPSSALSSVLLDYQSPMMPVSLYQALRTSHWQVVASVGVFSCLKLTVFFSTGLLSLQTSRSQNQVATVAFEAGGHNNFTYPSTSPYAMTGPAAADIEQRTMLSYIASTQRGAPWPDHTLPQAAFQELSKAQNHDIPDNSSILADVKAFYPSLQCNVANGTYKFISNFTINPDGFVEKINDNLGARLFAENKRILLTSLGACNPSDKICAPYQLVPIIQLSNDWYIDQAPSEQLLPSDRFMISLVLLTSEEDANAVPRNSSEQCNAEAYDKCSKDVLYGNGWIQRVSWSSSICCKGSYAIESARLSLTKANDGQWHNKSLSPPLTNSGQVIKGYSFENLTFDLFNIISYAPQYILPDIENIASTLSSVAYTASSLGRDEWGYAGNLWFQLMKHEASLSDDDITLFKDPTRMILPAQKVFQGLSSMWIGPTLSFPDQPTANATYTYESQRLRVSGVPFWAMEAILLIALISIAALSVLLSHRYLWNGDHGFVMDADTLKRSPHMSKILRELSSASDKDMLLALAGQKFQTSSLSNQFLFINSTPQRPVPVPTSSLRRPTHFENYWSQLPIQHWFLCMTLLIAISVCVILEVVQKISDNRSGGIKIDQSTWIGQDLIPLIPALVMLIISMLFGSIEFVLLSTSQYLRLFERETLLCHLQQSPLQQLPPVALFQQLRLRQFGTVLMVLSAFLASTLTITVSGLFTTNIESQIHSTSVFTADEFHFTRNITAYNLGSAVFVSIQEANNPFVDGTYHEFAFPTFIFDSSDNVVKAMRAKGEASRLQVDMPVVRASLNCSILPPAALETGISFGLTSHLFWNVSVISTSPLPPNCQHVSPVYTNSTEFRIQTRRQSDQGDNFMPTMAEVLYPQTIDPTNSSLVLAQSSDYYPPSCPSVAFNICRYTNSSKVADMTNTSRAICTQFFEEIPSTLTFRFPDLSLDEDYPPVLHIEKAQVVSDVNWNFPSIFHLGGKRTSDESYGEGGAYDIMDGFFHALVRGVDGIPLTELEGPENQEKFINTVQHIYRVFMAQILGNDMRQKATSNVKLTGPGRMATVNNATRIGTRFNARIDDTTRVRLVQNRIPKIILQSCLAAMVVGLALAYRDLRKSGRILPHNPLTIAGRMSFLAGSRFCEELDQGRIGRSVSEKELVRRLGNENIRLRLGWWESKDVSTNSAVINEGNVEEAEIAYETWSVVGQQKSTGTATRITETRSDSGFDRDVEETISHESASSKAEPENGYAPTTQGKHFGIDMVDSNSEKSDGFEPLASKKK